MANSIEFTIGLDADSFRSEIVNATKVLDKFIKANSDLVVRASFDVDTKNLNQTVKKVDTAAEKIDGLADKAKKPIKVDVDVDYDESGAKKVSSDFADINRKASSLGDNLSRFSLSNIIKKFKNFGDVADRVKKSVSGIGPVLRDAASVAIGINLADIGSEIFQGIVNFFGSGLDFAVQSERFTKAIEVVYGDVETAAKIRDDILDFAASTPFKTEDLFDSAQLLSIVVPAERLQGVLENVGKVAAATGQDLQGVSLIYQQAISKGFVDVGDINQLAGRGIQFQNVLADITGKSVAEVRKLASQGKITAEDLEDVFNVLATQDYADALDKQAGSLGGLLSTLSDNIDLTSKALVEVFEPAIKGTISFLIDFIRGARENLLSFVEFLGTTFEPVGAAFNRLFEAVQRLFQPIINLFSSIDVGSGSLFTFRDIVSGIAAVLEGLINTLTFVIDLIYEYIDVIGLLTLAIGAWNARTIALTVAEQAKNAVQAISIARARIETALTNGLAKAKLFLTTVLQGARVAMTALNTAMRANPIGAVITAVTLLIGGLVILYNRFETVRKVVDTVGTALYEFAGLYLGFVIKQFGSLFDIIAGLVTLDFDQIKEGFSGFFGGNFDEQAGKVNDSINKVVDTYNGVGEAAGKANEKIKELGGGLSISSKNVNNFTKSVTKDASQLPKAFEGAFKPLEEEQKRLEELNASLDKTTKQIETLRKAGKDDADATVSDLLKVQQTLSGEVSKENVRIRRIQGGPNLRSGSLGAGGASVQREVQVDTIFTVDEKAVKDQIKDVKERTEDIVAAQRREREDIAFELDLELNPVDESVEQTLRLEREIAREREDLFKESNEIKKDEQERVNNELLKLEEEYIKRKKKVEDDTGTSPKRKNEILLELEKNYNEAVEKNKILSNEKLLALDVSYYTKLDSLEQLQEQKRAARSARNVKQLEEDYNKILQKVQDVNSQITGILLEDSSIENRSQAVDQTFANRFSALDTESSGELDTTRASIRGVKEQIFQSDSLEQRAALTEELEALEQKEVALIRQYNSEKLKLQLEYFDAQSKLGRERLDELRENAEEENRISKQTLDQIQDSINTIKDLSDQLLNQGNLDNGLNALSAGLASLANSFTPIASALTNLSTGLRDYQIQANEVNAEQDRRQQILQTLLDKEDEYTSGIDASKTNIANLTNEIDILNQQPKTDAIQKTINDKQEEILVDQARISGLNDSLADLQPQIKVATDNAVAATEEADEFLEGSGKKKAALILGAAEAITNVGFQAVNNVQAAIIKSLDFALTRQLNQVQTVEQALLQGGDAAKNFTEAQLEAEQEKARELETIRRQEIAKQQAFTAFQLAANAAIAIAKAFATLPPPANAIVAATTAAALIASLASIKASASAQTPSAVAKEGGIIEGGRLNKSGVLKGRRHTSGGIIIEAEDGEAIFSRDKTKRFQSIFNAIQSGKVKSEKDIISPPLIRDKVATPIVATKEVIRKSQDIRTIGSDRVFNAIKENTNKIHELNNMLRAKPSATVIADKDGLAASMAKVIHGRATKKQKNSIK